jgi:hypothetical protein
LDGWVDATSKGEYRKEFLEPWELHYGLIIVIHLIFLLLGILTGFLSIESSIQLLTHDSYSHMNSPGEK